MRSDGLWTSVTYAKVQWDCATAQPTSEVGKCSLHASEGNAASTPAYV